LDLSCSLIDAIGLQDRISIMDIKERHSGDAKEEDTTFINGSKEVVQQIAYVW